MIIYRDREVFLKNGYRNPTGFRRWLRQPKVAVYVILALWEYGNLKTDTSIYYSIILFSCVNTERNYWYQSRYRMI